MNARVLCCDKERVKNKVASKFKVSFFDEQKHENWKEYGHFSFRRYIYI